MLLLQGRITEFLLQHIFFQSILFCFFVCLFVSEGAGAVAFWDHKMNREIGKEIYSRCTEYTEVDPWCFKLHIEAGQQTARVRSNQFVAQRHPQILNWEVLISVTLHTSDMHTSSRMQQELQSVIPSTTYTWTPTYVFMFFLKLC